MQKELIVDILSMLFAQVEHDLKIASLPQGIVQKTKRKHAICNHFSLILMYFGFLAFHVATSLRRFKSFAALVMHFFVPGKVRKNSNCILSLPRFLEAFRRQKTAFLECIRGAAVGGDPSFEQKLHY